MLAAILPQPDPARAWLREELGRREYQPSPATRVQHWIRDLFDQLTSAAGGSGLSTLGALVLLVVLAAGLALVLSRLRTSPGRAPASADVFDATPDSARQHRDRAARALADKHWDDAVVESVRALATELLERDLVVSATGITAREVTGQAAGLFPDAGVRLERLAQVFDDTRYGERPATEQAARDAVALESELSRATPAVLPRHQATLAVPR